MNALAADSKKSVFADVKWGWLLAIALLYGGISFYVSHDFRTPLSETYAPWADSGEAVASGGNVVKGAALGVICLFGLWCMISPANNRMAPRGWVPLLFAIYTVWCVASVLWSISPGQSIRKLLVLFFGVVGAVGAARKLRPRDLMLLALIIFGTYSIVGLANELVQGTFQPWVGGYRFSGTIHPNGQAVMLTFSILAAIGLYRNEPKGSLTRLLFGGFVVVAFGLLLLTKSRTPTAGLLAAMLFLWLVHANWTTRTAVVGGIVLLVCVVGLWMTALDIDATEQFTQAVLMGRQDESEAFTGRLPIWTELTNYIAQRPLIGFGYEAFWQPGNIEAISEKLHWPFREAHSTFFDGALSIGLVGMGMLIVIYLLCIYETLKSWRRTQDESYAFVIGMLVVLGVLSFMESVVNNPASMETIVCKIGIAYVTLIQPRKAAHTEAVAHAY